MQVDHPKRAATDHPILDLVRDRWSPRAFARRAVHRDDLLSLLEAARWAPSAFNEQPWRFVVATRDEPELYERVLGCLVEKNREWARQAPVLMLALAHRSFSRNDRENRHALHDLGQAVALMSVEATARGLYVHQMAGILRDEARAAFGVPEGVAVVTGIAVGYLGDPATLPEDRRAAETRPRSRKALGDLVFGDRFGDAPDWVRG